MSSLAQAIPAAVNHFQAGEWPAAERACYQILSADPKVALAWQILGLVAFQLGNNDLAEARFLRAIELEPNFAAAHYNLGNAFRLQGKLNEAVECYLRALALQPGFTEALQNLALAWHLRGDLEEASACYRQALAKAPDWAVGCSNLGQILNDCQKFTEALGPLQRAVVLQPRLAVAHNNLGITLQGLGQLPDAKACYARALELAPSYAEARGNLGMILQAGGELDEAIVHYRQALVGDFPGEDWLPTVGNATSDLHNNLGTALKDQGLVNEAVVRFRLAIASGPAQVTAYSNLLYSLYFCEGYDALAIYEEHRRFDEQLARPLARSIQPHANDRNPDRRLRIGYVSPDFCYHCQSLFTLPLLSAHDQQQFEIICYSDVRRPDAMTPRLRLHAKVWRDIRDLSDHQAAALIRQDQIDILVDLTMHTAHGRPLLFARKPAPVQVCWLAYPGTTGLSAMDYRLTDPHLDPPGQYDSHYSEQSIHLPDSFWCYQPIESDISVNPLPALTNGSITFGCLNNFCKVNPTVLSLWARVLRTVDNSRLRLLAPTGSARQRVLEILSQDGISPERIIFVDRRPLADYLRLYRQVDICLDTLPYNGHTTSLDSLWMGVPVVTLVGQTVAGRGGLSQLTNLGLTDLVAETPDQFVKIAAEFSDNLPRLNHLRASLRERMQSSPLMNVPRFARNIENAFRQMWQRWSAG